VLINVGRVFQVTVDSVHDDDDTNETVSASTLPAVAPVVVRITNDADCNVSPAGAAGNVNLYSAHN
jgi:hypothetical protein